MLRLGISSTCIWQLSPVEAIHFTKKLALSSFELWADHYFSHGESPKDIKAAFRDTGLVPIVHAASWDLNLTSTSRQVREFSMQQVRKSIDLALAIGARIITIHPGRRSFLMAEEDEVSQLQQEAFEALLGHIGERDLHICIENIEKTAKEVMVSEEDFLQFFSGKNDPLYVTMDVAHLESYERIAGFYSALKQKIKHVHISDLNPVEMHLPMGMGVLDVKRVLSFLMGSYRGIYSLEFYSGDPEGRKVVESVRYLRKIEKAVMRG